MLSGTLQRSVQQTVKLVSSSQISTQEDFLRLQTSSKVIIFRTKKPMFEGG